MKLKLNVQVSALSSIKALPWELRSRASAWNVTSFIRWTYDALWINSRLNGCEFDWQKSNQNLIETCSYIILCFVIFCPVFSPVIKKKLGMYKWTNVSFSKSAITFEQHVAHIWNLANICQIISLAIIEIFVMIQQGIDKILSFPWWGIFLCHPVDFFGYLPSKGTLLASGP